MSDHHHNIVSVTEYITDQGEYVRGIVTVTVVCYCRGVPRIWQGGLRIFLFKFGNLHVAKRHAAHGKAMHFVRGVRGYAPSRIFFKMVQFGAFWTFGVCFDQILSLKNFKNYHFLYKKFKNCNFLYKRITVLDTRNVILMNKILKNL